MRDRAQVAVCAYRCGVQQRRPGFFLVGVVTAAGSPGDPGEGAAGWSTRTTSPSKPIGWPEIESFAVGAGRSGMGWPALTIRLNDGSRVITNVASFTARHRARIARELTALRAEVAATAVMSPGTAGAEPE